MPRIETLIDLYLDANILLVLAFAAWWLADRALRLSPLREDYVRRAGLAETLMLCAVVSPALAAGLVWAHAALVPGGTLNAVDLAVAQYLEGRIGVRAERFEALLASRDALVADIARMRTPLATGLGAVFALGVLASLAGLARDVRGLRRLVGGSFVWHRIGSVDLRLSDRVSVPFSARGVRRRHVVLPTEMLAHPRRLRVALTHELAHLRRGDTEWELALSLLQPLFFWNPAFLAWRRELGHLRELRCDQIVLGRGRVLADAYASCLLDVCGARLRQRADGPGGLVVPFVELGLGRGRIRAVRNLRQRLLLIAARPVRHRFGGILAVPALALSVSLLAFGAAAIREPGDWSQDRLMLSTIVNLERLETRNGASGF